MGPQIMHKAKAPDNRGVKGFHGRAALAYSPCLFTMHFCIFRSARSCSGIGLDFIPNCFLEP
jgi:hypothetical protein